jgi:Coenzyme PQQ synthesis protein D (PqqD)
MTACRWIIRPTGVAHQTIDGESVIIDMQQGAYYRLEGAAASLWEQLATGATAEQLSSFLAARFLAERPTLDSQVIEFLDALDKFNLIVGNAPGSASSDLAFEASGDPLPVGAEAKAAFLGLDIHRFTDLQELIWLDPVHEVDDTGWPSMVRGPPKD